MQSLCLSVELAAFKWQGQHPVNLPKPGTFPYSYVSLVPLLTSSPWNPIASFARARDRSLFIITKLDFFFPLQLLLEPQVKHALPAAAGPFRIDSSRIRSSP